MKKNKILVFLLILFIGAIPTTNAKAITASMSCSSQSSVTLGNTISVTIRGNASEAGYWEGMMSYDSSKLQLISGSARIFDESAGASKSYSYTFKAIATGSAYVKMDYMKVANSTGDSETTTSSSPCSINVVKQSTSTSASSNNNSNKNNNVNKDSDNSLKSLSIDDQKLNPEFNKDTLEYSVELENNVEKIKINAEATSSKASIKGTGEIDVKEGLNKIEVVVTAENGSTRTYIINATVKEKDPIKVKVAGKEYTIVRKLDGLKIPTTFTEKDITINEDTIKGCYNDNLNYTLVALKDDKGKINFFIYNERKNIYSKFTMISSADLNVIVLKLEDKDDIPYNYKKTTFKYNDETIEGFVYGKSDFRVIYGINTVTGEEDFYQYDTKDNTLQRFFNEQTNLYVNLIQKCKLAFIILGSMVLLFTIIIIVLLSKNVKFKKKYLKNRLNEIDDPNYNKIRYEDIEENNEELEEKLSKKELKKLKKEEKRKEKSEKTFLDE